MNASRLLASLVLAATAATAIAGDTPHVEELLTMRVEGTIAVDAQGAVIAHTIDTQVEPVYRELIDKAIAQWKFMPVTVDGKPANARSNMRITLGARKVGKTVGEGVAVRIENVLFYERHQDGKGRDLDARVAKEQTDDALWKRSARMAITKMTRKIEYPRGYNMDAAVTMVFRANPDGTVADVVPTQCSVFNARATPGDIETACKTITTTAARAIRTWKLDVQLNDVEPTPDALSSTLPIVFIRPLGGRNESDEARREGQWRAEARTPFTQAPWLKKDGFTQQVGTSDVENGEMIPSRSTLQLRSGNT